MSTASNASACPPIFPDQVPCGGQGVCVVTNDSSGNAVGNCACNAGFSSLGEWYPETGKDCDVYIPAIQGLWGIVIVIATVPLFLGFRYVFLRYQSAWEKNESVHWNTPMHAVPLFSIAFGTVVIAWGAGRVHDPVNFAVGASPGATLCISLAFAIFWFHQFIFLYSFVDLVIAQSRMKSTDFKEKILPKLTLLRRGLQVAGCLTIILAIIPLLIIPLPGYAYPFVSIHSVGAVLNAISVGLFLIPRVLLPIRQDILDALRIAGYTSDSGHGGGRTKKDQLALVPQSPIANSSPASVVRGAGAARDDRLEAMKVAADKLKSTTDFIFNQACQQAVLILLFGVWPYFIRKAGYQLAISYTVGATVCATETHLLTNFSKRSSAVAKRSPKEAPTPSQSSIAKVGDSSGPETLNTRVASGRFASLQAPASSY